MRGRTVTLITAAAMVTSLFATAPADAAMSLGSLAAQRGKHFGAGIDVGQLRDVPYTTILDREFNAVTPTDSMKWDATEPTRNQFNFTWGDRIVAYAQQRNMIVRGHTLVWHSQVPAWTQSLNATMLRESLTNHVTRLVAHYRGAVYAWNVVNEPLDDSGGYRNSFFYQRLGASYIAESFRAARAADPGAKLYISESGAEGYNAKSTGLYNLVRSLLAEGVPIDGVAFQGHVAIGQVPPGIAPNFQRFADLGLDIVISELDVRMPMPRTAAKDYQQATDYSTMVRACLVVPRCKGVTLWTFSDKYSQIPYSFPGQGAATPWDVTMQPKPAYNAIYTTLIGG
ncbi:endo-1,4-beta-xylanase [Sphaerisporangium sp. B11E5]|uniref:endo-1,4-beta-xylanase n=1 Tax=Sphaerisporangium sp. B11E5 TaxID=3153563 RepID=UPI00325E5A0E